MEQADQFNGSATHYTLDKADRLTGIQHSADGQTLADYQYTLDNNGNRIKAVVEEPKKPEALINRGQGHTYNAPKNRLLTTQLNGTTQATFSYDHEGRQQTKSSTNFTFDHAHRLIQRGNEHYVYDGVGNRIRATRSGTTTKYIFDAAGNLLAEANAANTITKYYIYGQGLIGFVDASTNQLYTYHFDGTGHTVAVTDQNQNIVNRYAYDPYGRLMAQSETIAQPFKYAGQFGVQAEENNLYYMRARYYDADIGRFISEDPIGFEGGLNLYAYAGGNPVMFVDPSGFSAERIGISQAQIAQFQQDAFDIAMGIALPVSRIGNLLRGAKGAGQFSKYEDITAAGSRYANRATDVTKDQFEKNLLDSGFARSLSRDGKAIIFEKDGSRYILRDGAKSTGGPTADFYKPGSQSIDLKIRLEQGAP